ncbi:MAG: hypothetical protein AB8F74_05905 [Saprospiraceae bacterium]
MKTSSTFLYDLVKTLTKSEKRYIKVQAGTGGKDYLDLLDALIAQPVFDEEQLIQEHQGAKFLKHLAVNKRYLYELLLQSLARFGQKTVEEKVQDKIGAVNILVEKGLFAAALSELRKGQKIAEQYELFDLQIVLSGLRKKLLARKVKKKKDNSIQLVYETERERLEQLTNTNEYWYLAQQMVQFQTQFQKIQTKEHKEYIASLTQSSPFQNPELATNFKSRMYFYQANSIYQFMLGNVKKAYNINSQFLDLLESNSHFMKIHAQRYLATLNNMLIDSLMIGEYDVLKRGINRLVKTLERPEFKSIKNIEARVFRQRYLLLINWSLSQQDFEKATEWIPEIEKGLETFGNKIEKHHRITFYYLIAYLLFQNVRYDNALKWNNLIINDPKEDVVKEIFHFARVMNLLIHFELGNYTLLESLLLSTPKYLKNRRAIYTTEKTLFQFLGKQLNTLNKSEKRKLIVDFKEKLDVLYKKPEEKRVFNYLDLRQWIQKKK